MRVVDRSRLETKVSVRTMGMKVPRSPTAPDSSDIRLCLRRRPWGRSVVVMVVVVEVEAGVCCEAMVWCGDGVITEES